LSSAFDKGEATEERHRNITKDRPGAKTAAASGSSETSGADAIGDRQKQQKNRERATKSQASPGTLALGTKSISKNVVKLNSFIKVGSTVLGLVREEGGRPGANHVGTQAFWLAQDSTSAARPDQLFPPSHYPLAKQSRLVVDQFVANIRLLAIADDANISDARL
jgi:hypothetical protein